MYPKVKVRAQRDEADRYAYEKSSLQSLKAFQWLSLNHSCSSDESPVSVARVPRSYVPLSPPPSYLTSKAEETDKKKANTARPTSAPRPRAVLSSPENDLIVGRKTQARQELLSDVKNQSRHSKIFPKSTAAESFRGHTKESAEPRSGVQTKGVKGRTPIAAATIRIGHQQKKIAPPNLSVPENGH